MGPRFPMKEVSLYGSQSELMNDELRWTFYYHGMTSLGCEGYKGWVMKTP